MNFYAISALVNVVTSVILGFLILFADRRNRANQLFSLFALAVAVWGYAYFSWQIASDPESAILWVRVLMAGAIFIPFFYFHFVVRFLGKQWQLRRFVWTGYITVLFFSIVNWSPAFISSVVPRVGFPYWPVAGPLFLPFLIVWVAYAAYPVWLLFKRLRATDDIEERAQITYILIGTAIGYAGGCTNYFLWYGIPVLPYGNITASLYIIFVAYAILKHGLFSMKVVATEFIVFALWLFVFIRMLLAVDPGEQLVDGGLLFVLLIVGVLLIRSVDREVEQREKIQKLAEELQETNERQEGLIHFIGHEVKGFLTKAEGAFAALSDGDFGQLPDELKPFVEHSLAETRQGVDSVATILKASNLKKGTVTYAKEPFDLKALAAEAVEKAQTAASQKGLTLTFTADDASYQMTGDKAQINDHVLRNLIDNAINYTPSGSIAVSLKRDGAKLVFAVKDSGIGITDEDKRRLFTEGGHGKDSVKVNVHSTGYGLFIAKQITEAHGGTIRAESEGQGKGSTFTAEFPV
ncbi:MAG TPA: ATP-binding protein [Candidatus Paceibacterota bacterium]|nr:ATP-binding protein [Candidatus Paceibacterota bacterium]